MLYVKIWKFLINFFWKLIKRQTNGWWYIQHHGGHWFITQVSQGLWIDPTKFRYEKSIAKKNKWDMHLLSWELRFSYHIKWHYTTKLKEIIKLDQQVLAQIIFQTKLGPKWFIWYAQNEIFFLQKTNGMFLLYLLVPFILPN